MNAHSLIRDAPWYRREAFENGLKAAGHTVTRSQPTRPDASTLLLIWNRYGAIHDLASRVEAAGGTVMVAENGYIGRGGTSPKFDVHPNGPKPEHYYALSLGYHNDATRIRAGGCTRLIELDLDLKPERQGGDYDLICPNRSFGPPERMMHPDWAKRTAAALSSRPTRIRSHPGNNAPTRTLAEDLRYAASVYIWSSSCGVHALVDGVPVVCAAPFWICAWLHPRDHLTYDEMRWHLLIRMSWAQWTLREIESGEPFHHLLKV